jgi:hypothetical protein
MGDTFLMQPAGVIIMVSQSEAICFLVSLVETSVSCSKSGPNPFSHFWKTVLHPKYSIQPIFSQSQAIYFLLDLMDTQVYPL